MSLIPVANPTAAQAAALKNLEKAQAAANSVKVSVAKANAAKDKIASDAAAFAGMEVTATSRSLSASDAAAFAGMEVTATSRSLSASEITKMSAAGGAVGAVNPLVERAKSAANKLAGKLGLGGSSSDLINKQIDNLVSAKLAPTILKTGPKDELLAVDVLGLSGTEIKNSLAGKLSGFAKDMFETFRSNGGRLSDLTSLLKKDGGGIGLNTDLLKDRIKGALTSPSLMNHFTGNLKQTLTQNMGLDPKVMDQIDGTINNVVSSFSSGRLGNARGIFDFVQELTGNDSIAELMDVGAEANLLTGMFREAIELGIPDAIDQLIDHSRSDTATWYALRANVEYAVTMSDLDTTARMVEELGVDRVLADVPDAADRLISGYHFPEGLTASQYQAQFTKLKSVLDSLQPGWDTFDRNGTPISDLSLFSRSSQDALTLFSLQPTMAVAAAIAKDYPAVAMVGQAKQMYPYAVM